VLNVVIIDRRRLVNNRRRLRDSNWDDVPWSVATVAGGRGYQTRQQSVCDPLYDELLFREVVNAVDTNRRLRLGHMRINIDGITYSGVVRMPQVLSNVNNRFYITGDCRVAGSGCQLVDHCPTETGSPNAVTLTTSTIKWSLLRRKFSMYNLSDDDDGTLATTIFLAGLFFLVKFMIHRRHSAVAWRSTWVLPVCERLRTNQVVVFDHQASTASAVWRWT